MIEILKAALAAAKKTGDATQIEAAEKALATALAAEGKYKHTKKTETETEEDDGGESDDAEDESAEDAEDAEDESAEDEKSGDEPPESEPDSSGSDDEKGDAKSAAYVLAVAREITGEKSTSGVIGALQAMAHATKNAQRMSERLQKLERSTRADKVNAMVRDGMRTGKLTPALRKWASDLGMKDPRSLKAYLKTAAAMPGTLREAAEPTERDAQANGETVTQLCNQFGIKPEQFAAAAQRNGAGKYPAH